MGEEIRYGELKEFTTVEGWICKKCKRFWGDSEHMASTCCITVSACKKCGKDTHKYWTLCCDCKHSEGFEKYWQSYQKNAVEWDGVAPLFSDRTDKYYFHAEDLGDDLDEYVFGKSAEEIFDEVLNFQLRLCEHTPTRHFEMNDYLCDSLGEDQELDTKEIDKIVNDWIKSQEPISWQGTGSIVTVESVIAALDIQPKSFEEVE